MGVVVCDFEKGMVGIGYLFGVVVFMVVLMVIEIGLVFVIVIGKYGGGFMVIIFVMFVVYVVYMGVFMCWCMCY